MSKNVIALEFDSEVLVNQPPVLKLANGNFATFLTQYDSKTLLFAASKEDIGQEITEIIDGAIESMHNLSVSLEGAGVPGGKNGAKAAIHEVPEFTGAVNGEGTVHENPVFEGGINGEEAAVHDVPDFSGGVNGEVAAIHEVPEIEVEENPPGTIHEVPEFEGGVNAVEAAKSEVPSYEGGTNAVEAAKSELPSYEGGANAVEAAKSEVPSYEGGANAVEAVKSELPSYEGGAHEVQSASSDLPTLADGVNEAEAAVHKVTEYKADPSTAVQAMAQEHTYQAPAAQQHLLPKTGSEDKSSIAIVGFVGMFLGLLMIGKKRE